ncbi:MAG: hypothetical protein WC822_02280 [Candidatus Paceibacterota bacterium]|jgi:hypothetical protein
MENKETLDELLARAQKGATAGAAKAYLDEYIWAKIWRLISSMANCEPELAILLQLRGELRAHLLLAQELKLDLDDARNAVGKLRGAYFSDTEGR